MNGIQRLGVQGDSRLFIKQVSREFALKEIMLVAYRTVVQNLINLSQKYSMTHGSSSQQTC